MKRFVYFLMVGLAFTALQLSTVSAQTGMPPMGDPMCFDPARGEIPCSEMSGANPNMAPPVSTMPPTGGMPPMGDHSGMGTMGMSNLGDHCGAIQAKK